MPRALSHSDYYRDRRNERDLCFDFPGDELYIDGLHAMQMHFVNRGMQIDIPVVRVMNTVHWLTAYMYSTTCSGDQTEYDVLTYNSVGCNKQLTVISLIVLVAMLKRTADFRASACRDILLENRDEDFYEGVSLYERFLESGADHFAQEDFETDIMLEMRQRDELIEQQAHQIKTLQKQIKNMNQNKLYYKCNFNTTYNTTYNTTNNYYPAPSADAPVEDEPEEPQSKSPKDIWGIPQKGKYNQVREYIEDRKKGDPEFKEFCLRHSLREICTYLTDEFGWDVDEHSLGANMNRNRNSHFY